MLMQNLFRQYYRMLQLVVIVHPFINVIFVRPHFYLLQTALSPHTEKTIGYTPLQILPLGKRMPLMVYRYEKLIQQTITHLILFYRQ